jgi:hypothetical protein
LKIRTSINSIFEIHKEKEMVAFRRWLPALAVVTLMLGGVVTASAQVNSQQMTCFAVSSATPLVRAEGIAELVGDAVYQCTGGTPTPAGQQVPQVNVQIFLNTNVTSRLVADPLSEALLLIDDPTPGNQRPCVPATGFTNCPLTGVGGNGIQYITNTSIPNVYQGRNGGANSIAWLGVPIDPPGTLGTRIIRITNIRANASGLGVSSTLIPTQIVMYASVTPPQALPIGSAQQVVAFVQPGLSFSLRTAAGGSAPGGGTTFLQCVSNNRNLATDNTAALQNGFSFMARFSEGFASSFKRRNVALGSSADVSPTPADQPNPGGVCNDATLCPGGLYYTETGLYNSTFTTTNGLNRAGLADHGTRLMARFSNVPAGVVLYAGVYENGATAATSRVRLVNTDGSGGGPFAAATTTSGSGATAIAPITISGGSGIAVWEVMNANPLAIENIDIPIAVSFSSNTASNLPGLGTSTVVGSFAPLSTVTTQSSTAPLPRFADSPISRTSFVINACSTNLLFPFVTNQAGFDTGIAISNTSQDPFGTATQAGACKINYYGNSGGTTAAPPAQTSGVVDAGTQLLFVVSTGGNLGITGTPNFQGYVIAQCAFQYAHGFAFVTDGPIGQARVAEGYLALVMDNALAPSRTGFTSEVLAH